MPRGRHRSLLALTVLAGVLAIPAPAAGADTGAPVVSTPVVRPKLGSEVGTTVPFTVSWSAADPSGVRRYAVQRQVDGGSWETLSLSSATATSLGVRARPPHEYAYRVRATDAAGNTSGWVTAPAMRVRRVSERAVGVSTTGDWTLASNDGFLGDRALRSGSAGATLSFAFTGSQVAWYGTLASSRGRAEILLDGGLAATVDLHRSTTSYRRVLFRHAWVTSGPHTITIRVLATAGHPLVDVDGFVVVDPPAPDPVLVGAGDVAICGGTGDSRTAALLDGIAGRVFAAGDLAYPDGTTAQFRDCYGPTWGRWRSRTSPAPGNHEYHSSGAAPYYAYFGSRAGTAGQGWYAYDLGTWRVYSLNSNCTHVGCGPTSAQVRWLQADLADHPRACVAAVWHHPRFSSGQHGNDVSVSTLWSTLDAAGADVILNGHDHDYERFAPQTPTGAADAQGIREFVVGTGGSEQRPFATIRANSQVRNASAYGVLALTLRPGGYAWRFVPAAGDTFTDTGSASCH